MNGTTRIDSQHERALTPRLHPPKKATGSKSNSTRGLTPYLQLKGQAKFHASTQDKACLSCSYSTETPRSMSEMVRNTEVSASTRDEALLIPAATQEESRGPPSNSKADLISLRKHEWSPRLTCNSRGTLGFPQQLHKNHEIFPSMRDEALLRCRLSHEIPPSLLELERELDTLYKTSEASRDTRPPSKGMLSFPPQLKKSPVFPSSTRDEGRFPCFIWKGMPASLSHLKRRPVPT